MSTDTHEAHHPSDETTHLDRDDPNFRFCHNEVESVTHDVHLASNSNDATLDVTTINIGNAKAIKSWILTPEKQFARYLICGFKICKLPTLTVARFKVCFFFETGTSLHAKGSISSLMWWSWIFKRCARRGKWHPHGP